MIVFISGPMAGLENYNRHNFNAAEATAMMVGYKVVNPAILPHDWPPHSYLPVCMAMLDIADTVWMLEGWEGHKGAEAERAYALAQGKTIVYSEEELRQHYKEEKLKERAVFEWRQT